MILQSYTAALSGRLSGGLRLHRLQAYAGHILFEDLLLVAYFAALAGLQGTARTGGSGPNAIGG